MKKSEYAAGLRGQLLDQYRIEDDLAHIPELALRKGLTEGQLDDLLIRRMAYIRDRDAPIVAKAQTKRDRKAEKLAKIFGGKDARHPYFVHRRNGARYLGR